MGDGSAGGWDSCQGQQNSVEDPREWGLLAMRGEELHKAKGLREEVGACRGCSSGGLGFGRRTGVSRGQRFGEGIKSLI